MGMGEMAGADARSSSLLGQRLQADRWKSDQTRWASFSSQDQSALSTNARKQLASAEPVLDYRKPMLPGAL